MQRGLNINDESQAPLEPNEYGPVPKSTILELLELSKFLSEAVFPRFFPKLIFQAIKAFKHGKLHRIQTNDQATELPAPADHKWPGVAIGTL